MYGGPALICYARFGRLTSVCAWNAVSAFANCGRVPRTDIDGKAIRVLSSPPDADTYVQCQVLSVQMTVW